MLKKNNVLILSFVFFCIGTFLYSDIPGSGVLEKSVDVMQNQNNEAGETLPEENSGERNADEETEPDNSGTDAQKTLQDESSEENVYDDEVAVKALVYAISLSIEAGFNPKITYGDSSEIKDQKDKKQANVIHKFEGGVTEIVNAGNLPVFFVSGNDGFLTKYSYPDFQPDTWQVSRMPIKKIAVHPQGNLVAVYESDGFGVHQISLWNWNLKKIVFSKRLSDSVVSLSWSAKGSYLFAGNRSIDGIAVFDTAGNLKNIYQQAPGIVFLAATAMTEKNIVTYGESGRLVYTDIAQRKKVKEFKTESKLENPNLIKNFNQVIGYKNNAVYVIDAVTGKTLEQYPARRAVFAAKIQDTQPIWIERTNRKYEWCIRQGSSYSLGFTLPNNASVTAARHIQNYIIVGTNDGAVYLLGLNVDSSVKIEAPLEYSFSGTVTIAGNEDTLYILKNKNIYEVNNPADEPKLVLEGTMANCLCYYNNGLLLWSNSNKNIPIVHYSFETKKVKRIIQTKENIISLSVYKKLLLYVEAYNGVSVIDFDTGKRVFAYNAPGIQDAVQIDDENMIISKSSADKSQSPIFIINTLTQETIPVSIEGNLAFFLRKNEANSNTLNCFLVNSQPNKTELLTIILNKNKLAASSFRAVLSYKEEDVDSFLTASGNDILTNLGKNSLVRYNTLSKQVIRLPRFYSLPKYAVILKDYFVSLNFGGTVSWYDKKTNMLVFESGLEYK